MTAAVPNPAASLAAAGASTSQKQSASNSKITEPLLVGRAVADVADAVATTTAVQAEVIEKATRNLTNFAQSSLEAATRSGQILTAGWQDLFRQTVTSGQSAFEEILSGFQTLASAKTMAERIELQVALVRASASRAFADTSHFTKTSFDLAEKVSAPLSAHAALAADTFSFAKVSVPKV
jgi:phasin family protein